MRCRRRLAAVALVLLATACTPEQLIRIRWAGTPHADRMVALATRESSLSCNPPRNGTGAGLFQLVGHQGIARAAGVTWEQVNSDCMANIEVTWRLYQACGTGPWTPIRVNGKTVWPCTPGR